MTSTSSVESRFRGSTPPPPTEPHPAPFPATPPQSLDFEELRACEDFRWHGQPARVSPRKRLFSRSLFKTSQALSRVASWRNPQNIAQKSLDPLQFRSEFVRIPQFNRPQVAARRARPPAHAPHRGDRSPDVSAHHPSPQPNRGGHHAHDHRPLRRVRRSEIHHSPSYLPECSTMFHPLKMCKTNPRRRPNGSPYSCSTMFRASIGANQTHLPFQHSLFAATRATLQNATNCYNSTLRALTLPLPPPPPNPSKPRQSAPSSTTSLSAEQSHLPKWQLTTAPLQTDY